MPLSRSKKTTAGTASRKSKSKGLNGETMAFHVCYRFWYIRSYLGQLQRELTKLNVLGGTY